MRTFWGFYADFKRLEHPFRVFGIAHFLYITAFLLIIIMCFRKYKTCGAEGKRKWQRSFALYFFIQEMFFYLWTYVSCKVNGIPPLFEVLQLELCTACLFMNFSTLFHDNKQVRFFGAVMGLIGGPIAILYPATVAEIYPIFCYRMLNFFMTHASYIFFSLMLLHDEELLNKNRLIRNLGIVACMFTAVYFFDLKFGTQYMFVGTPPSIGIVRMIYDIVGNFAFLPTVLVIFSTVEVIVYFGVKKLQNLAYKNA